MNVLPVIVRELRSQARQPLTFNLRVLGASTLAAVCWVFSLGHAFTPNLGGALFGYLHTALSWTVWILVPFSAADCISRERREGTLGLLFLTPLKATDIVVAKGLAHGVRAATLLAAVLPVMTIPFLLGGLSWQQAATSALISFSSICWALAAALVASSRTRSGLRAMVTAAAFAFCALFAFAFVTGYIMASLTSVRAVVSGSIFPFRNDPDYTWLLGFGIVGASANNWRAYSAMFAPGQLLLGVAQSAIISAVALMGAVLLAAFRIRRTWREEPPPAWVRSLEQRFCTPVLFMSLFRRWTQWKLERNPIGWLEQRRWTGRLVMWSWFAVIISVYSAALSDRSFLTLFQRNFNGLQLLMGWLLVGSIASSAAGSFRRERENGMLELLLVAPLTARQIMGGRLRGLWGQFMPAMTLFLGVWFYFASVFIHTNSNADTDRNLVTAVFFGVTFLTLPVAGLYFSLRCRNFISAFLLTLVFAVLVPMALERLAVFFGWWSFGDSYSSFDWKIGPRPGVPLAQLAVAWFFGNRLRHRLERRAFPLEGMSN